MSDRRAPSRVSPTTVRTTARRAVVTGFALTIPLLVTLLVMGVIVNALSNVLDPIVAFTFEMTGSQIRPSETSPLLLKVFALVVLVVGVFCIGFVAERRSGNGRIESAFDATMKRIPGVGSLYTSFDEMSDMLLDSDTQSFKEVVLVEYPTAGSFTIAFVTASTPQSIEDATDNGEMVTLFMPMAPNPVMGGYVIHVEVDRVYDVDMTVEEGIRSIVTSGVAIGEGTVSTPIGAGDTTASAGHPAQAQYQPDGAMREPMPQTDVQDREAAYSETMDPEHAETPEAMARRQDTEETVGTDADHPEELQQGNGTLGDESDLPRDIQPPDAEPDAEAQQGIERDEEEQD
ncbi:MULTISPECIES: DUF502 domain-containing protein [Haloarcula]|uniref:DUF502 domain-containing protein n=1 Tax=Haloarcula TaxID=2237 RepID=UPI0016654EB6|nr:MULTISPECIES: DUF502 domain-containing protein [Halomicroarcula]MBX0347735.1 DUF502 domain-containing protein [Halomicroarcula pellucida]MDS0276332.1 DUF502 domain-containing protein [Halomicroarcula sp. S1AR25-4]